MKRHPALLLAMLLATALLSACGFHLRGATFQDSMPFKSIHVVIPESSDFGIELKRNLRAGEHTQVVADSKAAQVIMEVMEEKRSKSILSLNVQGRVREYALHYDVHFRVRDVRNREVMAPVRLSLRRTLIFSETHALARENEEDMLYRDMQTDMVQQVMRRLAKMKLPA